MQNDKGKSHGHTTADKTTLFKSYVACQLWKDAPSQNAKFAIFVGDDDTTTQAHLHQNVPYGVEKWSDVIHAKRSLTTRL